AFPRYLVVNDDEGEPGTFKDRELTERDPHAILEGILIAALAIRAELAYIYIRGEFGLGYRRMHQAIDDARAAGLVGRNIAVTPPGNYEAPLGTTLGQLIELAGGIPGGRSLKAVIPGGASAPWVTDTSLPMSFEALAAAGTMLGSGAVVVMDETTCAVRMAMV